MGPPPGGFGCSESTDEGIYKSVVIAIDADTGDPVSAGASKEPRPGPYVSRSGAINSARERITTRLPEAWLERARVEAYLRGDVWIVLFWEDGSKDNRIKASVDAVTGEAKGFSR